MKAFKIYCNAQKELVSLVSLHNFRLFLDEFTFEVRAIVKEKTTGSLELLYLDSIVKEYCIHLECT